MEANSCMLTARMHNLCSTLDVKHTTLMSFVNQSIVECLETYTTPNKKGEKQSPIVDASDVQRLMLALPFMLDDLVREELVVFNRGKPAAQKLADPMPEAIEAVNEWLHWYHMYRADELDEDSNAQMDTKGRNLIETLQRVFPYTVKVAPRSDKTRSVWSTEKVHSILHGSRRIEDMGRSRNISCQPTECKLKDVKAKGHMTNRNPATYGYSIMQAEAREASAQQMAQDADENGEFVKQIRTDTYDTYEYVRNTYAIRTNTYVLQKIRLCTYRTYCVRIAYVFAYVLRTYLRTYSYVSYVFVRIFCPFLLVF